MRDLVRLLRLYRPYRWWIALSVVLSVAATLANIGLLAVSGWFITAMAAAGLAGQAMNYFTPAALIRLFAIIRTAGRYADRVVSHETTFRLLAETRAWLFAKLVPLAPAALDDLHSGDLLTRLKTDIDRQELIFLRLVSPVLSAIACLVIVGFILALLDGRLALVVVGTLFGVGFAFPAVVAHGAASESARAADAAARLRRILVDTLQGLAPLLAAGVEGWRLDAVDARFASALAVERKAARLAGLGQVATGLSADLAMVVAAAVAIPLVRAGAMGGPQLTTAVLVAMATIEALAGLPNAFVDLPSTLASARRIFGIVDRAPAIVEPTVTPAPPVGRDIVFDGVSLDYRDDGAPALIDLDLTIPSGARVGIIGESGAGKSSLVDLLVRFRDPTRGEIRLGGVPLRSIAGDALRACFAVAPQRPHLFSASIADDLRVARSDASDSELLDAARRAGLAPLIARLPDGLATQVGAIGSALSGGEAKRVAIARALLVDAPILVLDEPGEGLDPDTERALINNLLDQWAGRTLVLLTHSHVGLERMDRVVELRGGRIADAE
jgi:ATP-binding cassette, subfamily C, bacterial CydC